MSGLASLGPDGRFLLTTLGDGRCHYAYNVMVSRGPGQGGFEWVAPTGLISGIPLMTSAMLVLEHDSLDFDGIAGT